MGSKSDDFENDILLLIFNNTDILLIGDAGGLLGSVGAGSFWVRLMTDGTVVDDSTLGTQATYTGYVAGGIAVARTAGGWTVSGNNASNTAAITFGASTSGPETERYVEVWLDNSSSSIGDRLFWSQLDSDLIVNNGITPEIPIGDLDINED